VFNNHFAALSGFSSLFVKIDITGGTLNSCVVLKTSLNILCLSSKSCDSILTSQIYTIQKSCEYPPLSLYPYPSSIRLITARRLGVLQNTRLATVNSAIVVKAISRVSNSPVAETSIVVIAQRIRSILTSDELIQSTHAIGTSLTGTTTQSIQRQNTIVKTHTHELVSCVGRTVAVLCRIILHAFLADSSGIGFRAPDNFGNEMTTKRRHLGENKVTVGVRWEFAQTGRVAEVV
jgi:hypothetical protein